jgi:DNA polymerase-4
VRTADPARCAPPSARSPTGSRSWRTARRPAGGVGALAQVVGQREHVRHDLTDIDEMRHEVAEMARDAAAWLLRRELCARTVTLKLRYSDFTTITRSHSDAPTQNGDQIERARVALLDRTEAASRRCGCSA